MSADLSGVRFDARNDFTKVVQQQGRVMLDADGNEQADLDDRRFRAQAADLGSFGPATDIVGTAVIPRTTPDAFRLSISGGVLTLGRGRMYVDGVLADNHGTGADELDPLLAEVRGAAATPYLDQPSWPAPGPPPLPSTGRHLVYLEVRERELTWVERPDLVDPAIAVDTTARTQVIWQAKVHAPDAPGITCATPDADIPGWAAVIAPSAARLSVATVPVPPASDPCSLPPSGDYRGLENQTYRVEIHAGGAAGTATFKWSRDNASVTIPVTEVASSTRLRLASLGKDSDALGLATGQWVEVLDDDHELAGLPGELRRITVHPEDRSISFAAALPAGWPTTADAGSRHLRVRRWDGASGATTVPAPAAAVELEHGITVTLALAPVSGSPGFRTGEHWVFAARTATTAVELLTEAPPVGPHRHVARLGIIEGTSVVSAQCAPLWPPDCDCEDDCACTVCVSVADHVSGTLTIQDGLDLVAATGGTVCLEVGTYPLDQPLALGGAAGVRLRGQGPGTLLVCPGDGLVIEGCATTTVEDLRLVSSGKEGIEPNRGPVPTAGIRLLGCVGATLARLVLVVEGEPGGLGTGIALHDLSVGTRIHDTDITAPVGVHARADLKLPLLLDDLVVAGNVLGCATAGVLADDAVLWAHGSHLRDNRIEAAHDAGIRLAGVLEDASSVRVAANHVVSGAQGIVVASGMTVADNTVVGSERGGGEDSVGIRMSVATLPGSRASAVTGNTIAGFQRAAALLSGGEPVRVGANRATRCDNGIGIAARGGGADVAVYDNEVLDIAASGESSTGVFGLLVAGAGSALLSGNTVGRVGTGWKSGEEIVGIGVLGCLSCRIATNEVYAIGPPDDGMVSIDYAVVGTVAGTIQGNQSLHALSQGGLQAFGLRLQAAGKLPVSFTGSGLGAATGSRAVYAVDDVVLVQALDDHEPSVSVGDNTFTGGVRAAAVDATVRGSVLLSHNHCSASDSNEGGAVRLRAETAAVTGNRVRGGKPSIRLDVPGERLTVLGNLTSSGIVAAGGLAPQWAPLNLDGVS